MLVRRFFKEHFKIVDEDSDSTDLSVSGEWDHSSLDNNKSNFIGSY